MASLEEGMKQVELEIAENKARVLAIIENEELLDEDGYPTDAALEAVEKWHWDDAKGWFQFIHSIWAYKSWGWTENDEPHEWNELEQYRDKLVHRYYISTAGWSGNESIIRSMEKNGMMWYLNWVESRRGGHYIFELKEFNDE